MQQQIIDKRLKFYVVDGYSVAQKAGMAGRFNTAMQTCFFALANVLPREQAIEKIKQSIRKTYGKRGESVLQSNWAAVDGALESLHEVKVPTAATSMRHRLPALAHEANGHDDFVKRVTAMLISGQGDRLPVSALPVDGTFPTNTARLEKRSIALEIPIWDKGLCTQCGLCALVCPHAAIRMKAFPSNALAGVPHGFESKPYTAKELPDYLMTIQVGTRRLHRLRRVRRCVPGQEQGSRQAQSDQHGGQNAASRDAAGQLRFLSANSRIRSNAREKRLCQRFAIAAAAI